MSEDARRGPGEPASAVGAPVGADTGSGSPEDALHDAGRGPPRPAADGVLVPGAVDPGITGNSPPEPTDRWT
ncbi:MULTISPECIES: hypothetical protein [Streptomyces]|uniref:Uncharacterized protein n=1 Tax=Streptomyces fimbriatus TaxID=68197 RepID=A0ABW0D4D3_STRFI